MSVYEGMEKKEKEQEGLEGEDEDEKKEGDEEKKEGEDEEKKEGFDTGGKQDPSPMSALTQSVFGSSMPWVI